MGRIRRRSNPARMPAVALVAPLAFGACRPDPPEPPAPAPVALEYQAPVIDQALYTVTDTTTFSVDSGGMGRMTVTAAFVGMAHMQLRPEEEALEGEIRYVSFRGSFASEPHGDHQVNETDIAGSFRVRIDPRGRFELVETPALSPELLDVTGPESLVRPLFVHLPARPAVAGDQWVDTVTAVEWGQETETRARIVITTTLAGDTLVDGRPLLLLRTHAENDIEVTGRSGGVAVRQHLTGVTTGTVVWDDRLHLLVERREEGHLTGTLDMEGTPGVGMPMTAHVRRSAVLER